MREPFRTYDGNRTKPAAQLPESSSSFDKHLAVVAAHQRLHRHATRGLMVIATLLIVMAFAAGYVLAIATAVRQ